MQLKSLKRSHLKPVCSMFPIQNRVVPPKKLRSNSVRRPFRRGPGAVMLSENCLRRQRHKSDKLSTSSHKKKVLRKATRRRGEATGLRIAR